MRLELTKTIFLTFFDFFIDLLKAELIKMPALTRQKIPLKKFSMTLEKRLYLIILTLDTLKIFRSAIFCFDFQALFC